MTSENKPSLLKQVLGAVIGGSLGLAVYYGYQFASPHLTAWTSIPERWVSGVEQNEVRAPTAMSEKKEMHLDARTQEIADRFGANYAKYQESSASSEMIEDDASLAAPVAPAATVSVSTTPVAIAKPTWFAAPHPVDLGVPPAGLSAAVTHEGAPELPSSGFGVLGISAVLGGSILGWKKRVR